MWKPTDFCCKITDFPPISTNTPLKKHKIFVDLTECRHFSILKSRLESIIWPCWQNQYSNTVLFKRPSDKIVAKYNLACGEAYGQKVSHIVVMQHVTKKAIDNIKRVAGGVRNRELFKKLENTEIWEFRTLYNKTAYRLFAFWDRDEETLVIATHGIIKKTQKTPSKEIAKAEAIRKEYFKNK